MILERISKVFGELRVPSDKSVSHRAVFLGSLAKGNTHVKEWLVSADTLATLRAFRALGVSIRRKGAELFIEGADFNLKEPKNVIDARNSGTTTRLLLGVLSTQPFYSVITGDESLRNRPMLRVVEPLRQMGANLDGREGGDKLPVSVRGGSLKGVSFFNKRASAQVKSALLLAGLKAGGITEVIEPYLSRDHTERMLRSFGAQLIELETQEGHAVKLEGGQTLHGTEVYCPADPSSASFFTALAVLADKGELLLRDVLINPTRDGFYRKLKQMGANIEYTNVRVLSGEQVADILVRSGNSLKAVRVYEEDVPSMIDEIPILAVVMAFAEGVSEVRGARELRVKESDRIRAVVENLRAMDVHVEEYEDGFAVQGGKGLRGALIRTYHDHRIAMAFSVAGLLAHGETIIDDPNCVKVSYPEFYRHLQSITS